jgi:hypothetical protein
MKKWFITIIIALSTIHILEAQTWKLCTGKKTLAQGAYGTIKEVGSTLVAMSSKYKDLKFQIDKLQDAANISILINNEDNQEIERFEFNNYAKGAVTLPMAKIKAALLKSKKVHINLVSLPTDPNKAAVIRVRPMYLCSLQ